MIIINKTGVYKSYKKNGDEYYRSSITYNNKHISLGSYGTDIGAHNAYILAKYILFDHKYTLGDYKKDFIISFEKWVILLNFRDNNVYIKNPIYLHKKYFSYYLNKELELKFDTDDLFYYSFHKIIKRNGYLFVNDYGSQINILSRYGIKNFAVYDKDYVFKNGDIYDFRHYNIEVINPYYGVSKEFKNGNMYYLCKINIKNSYIVGKYPTETEAAIAYNKAIDFILDNNINNKNYEKNYIYNLDSQEYKSIYYKTKISKKIKGLIYR